MFVWTNIFIFICIKKYIFLWEYVLWVSYEIKLILFYEKCYPLLLFLWTVSVIDVGNTF